VRLPAGSLASSARRRLTCACVLRSKCKDAYLEQIVKLNQVFFANMRAFNLTLQPKLRAGELLPHSCRCDRRGREAGGAVQSPNVCAGS
jgi:hypothetical protein